MARVAPLARHCLPSAAAEKSASESLHIAESVARDAASSGTQILRAALEHAKTTLAVRQVNLGVNTTNQAALALYRKLGLVEHGHERGFLCVDGLLYDEFEMVWRVDEC